MTPRVTHNCTCGLIQEPQVQLWITLSEGGGKQFFINSLIINSI
jgi:hypothetical protein